MRIEPLRSDEQAKAISPQQRHAPLRQWCIGLAITAAGVIASYLWLDQPLAFFVDRNVADTTIFVWLQRLPTSFPLLSSLILAWCGLWTLMDRPFSRVQFIALTCSISFISTSLINSQLKYAFGRTWPAIWIENNPSLIQNGSFGFNPFHGGLGFAAFPSGQAAAVCSVMAVLWWSYLSWRPIYVAVVGAVSIGLIGANYHFLSDILGGMFLGISVGYITTKISVERISMSVTALLFGLGLLGTLITAVERASAQEAPLRLETKIPLGNVRGRIDHMAADIDRRRLFVAELGNNTVGIVDVGQGKVRQVLAGLKEPQGVGYLPSTDTVYLASGGDGSLRLFQGQNYTANGRIDFGNDADNVRVDRAKQYVVVGYGDGALAVIDGAKGSKIADIRLPAHPEGFQLDNGGRAYVNVPNARGIAVADLPSGKLISVWPVGSASANFPMAFDSDSNHVLTVFRNPPKLGVFDNRDGSIVRMIDACGDADDLFLDAKRHRIYVSCGAGVIDIFDARSYERLSQIPTVSGARTSLFVPELDRLFVAVRATGSNPAGIWVLRPEP